MTALLIAAFALALVAASLYYARIPDSRPSEDVAAAKLDP